MRAIRAHLDRRANLGYHLWGLLVLFLWMRRWGIQPSARQAIQSTPFETQEIGESYLRCELIVVLAAASRFSRLRGSARRVCMDDVDAVQAQIARNMLDSGDWVSAHLDGIAYLEKSPLKYWLIAISYKIFGVHDWVARLPVALVSRGVGWLVFRIGAWAFSVRAGMYAGLAMATSVGLFLFTRIQIPDVTITATIALAMWAFLRALDTASRGRAYGHSDGGGDRHRIAAERIDRGGISDRGGAALSGLHETDRVAGNMADDCIRFAGALVALAIAAPWHVLATLRNPPYFDFTMHSAPGRVSRLLLVLFHE